MKNYKRWLKGLFKSRNRICAKEILRRKSGHGNQAPEINS